MLDLHHSEIKYFKAMIWVAFILLFLMGCRPLEEAQKPTGPRKELPLAEYRDTTILDMYEGSRLSWILKTQYLVKWPKTDLVKAKPVNLLVYDTLGKILVKVTADSGAVDDNMSYVVATGHVHGHSEKGVDIISDSLRWNKAINQVSTEARVRVVSEDGDVLTGKGFLSDAKLDNWQIISDVHGVFQKVQERFQKVDGDDSVNKTNKNGAGSPTSKTVSPVDSTTHLLVPKP